MVPGKLNREASRLGDVGPRRALYFRRGPEGQMLQSSTVIMS